MNVDNLLASKITTVPSVNLASPTNVSTFAHSAASVVRMPNAQLSIIPHCARAKKDLLENRHKDVHLSCSVPGLMIVLTI